MKDKPRELNESRLAGLIDMESDFKGDLVFKGSFRIEGSFKGTINSDALLVIGEKQEKPPLGETYREALKWALKVVRTPMVKPDPQAPEWYKDRHNGLAAYEAWAEHLLRDDDFPADNEAVLREHHAVHNDGVGMVADGRWYGSQLLIQMIEHVPYTMTEELLRAAACCAGEHDLMWKVWDLVGGNGYPEAHLKLADPAIRRQIVPLILQARDKDAEAADHIARALAE
jgi:hypothetical protein